MIAVWHPPGDRRFPKECRLLKKKEFDVVFREGRKVVRPSMVVFILRREGEGPARLGTSVSRKVGKSHDRNRVKRRLRELFRLHLPQFTAPCDVVIVARAAANGAAWSTLQGEFRDAMDRAGIVPGAHKPDPQTHLPKSDTSC